MTRLVLVLALVASVSAAPTDSRSPSEIYANKTAAEVPAGPEVFGAFRGRTPCRDLCRLMNVPRSEACNKVKCRLVLYQDPLTKAPTTYTWAGKQRWAGKWSIVKGTKSDPNATVYQLEPRVEGGFLSFAKVDDNILLVIDREGNPLVGNANYSYTLNRIVRSGKP
jgi:hypothetical protein